LDELEACLAELQQRDNLAGLIIISGKEDCFVSGPDMGELVALADASSGQVERFSRERQQSLSRLSRCPFVTVAAIDGACLGAGAALAAWCDRRIVSDRRETVLGFPEVTWGLLPMWGGTVRASRVVGLGNAAAMITSGEPIDARDAVSMKWATQIVPAAQLTSAAVGLIRDEQRSGGYLGDRQRCRDAIDVSDAALTSLRDAAPSLLSPPHDGQNPALRVALQVLLDGAKVPSDQACQIESEGAAQLLGTPVSLALIHVHRLIARGRHDTGVDRSGVACREIDSIGVIGAGVMGAGIAVANLRQGIPVVIMDADRGALRRSVVEIEAELSEDRTLGKLADKPARLCDSMLTPSEGGNLLADCDLVIESIVEDLGAKREVYRRIEGDLKPGAILASNTSTIPVGQLAEGLAWPDRFCGLHFFNPVRMTRSAEVIRGKQTSDQTVATAVAYCKRIGKLPIVVNDSPGFVVNRLLSPYLNAALELVIEGARIDRIDRAAVRFGMPLGPIELYDLIGLETSLRAGRVMLQAFPERIVATPILPKLIKAGRLGQKQGLGFYSYHNERRQAELDPDVDRLLEPFVRHPDRQYTEQELTARLFMPMLLEATHLLREHVVRDVRDIDLVMVLGVGFPPTKGGLLYWADSLGAARLIEMLAPLSHLGPRGQPTDMLRQMAATGGKFYANH
jgi:3-hydroxyacyl-CoA dehydrogenase/enoyl-CoA hydratase/3-hydroxybutyryl-CoA epimerase/3-hydroxyacyl-CoA dehydrogenase/enoyl-CoA hydratase/3-hydroxybutyryl-CoA epimerase/enoyl-CoA isomerase